MSRLPLIHDLLRHRRREAIRGIIHLRQFVDKKQGKCSHGFWTFEWYRWRRNPRDGFQP
jgi:hypothetical protein